MCSKQLELKSLLAPAAPPCRKMGVVNAFHIEGFRKAVLHGGELQRLRKSLLMYMLVVVRVLIALGVWVVRGNPSESFTANNPGKLPGHRAVNDGFGSVLCPRGAFWVMNVISPPLTSSFLQREAK